MKLDASSSCRCIVPRCDLDHRRCQRCCQSAQHHRLCDPPNQPLFAHKPRQRFGLLTKGCIETVVSSCRIWVWRELTVVRDILNILDGIVPLAPNVLWDVLYFLNLVSSPTGCVFWEVLDILGPVSESILDIVLCIVNLVLCMWSAMGKHISFEVHSPAFSPSCIKKA